MPRLVLLEGDTERATLISKEASICLGTGADNDICLPDPYVSRHHGRLSCVEGRWFYRDLGSKNGSAVERGGERIAIGGGDPDVEVRPGDLLCLGHSALRFEAGEVGDVPSEQITLASRGLADVQAAEERQLASLEGLRAAYGFERQIGLAFDPEQTLDAILSAILAEFAQATHAIIVLVDRKTRRPRRQVARVRGEPGRARAELPLSMSVAARVLSEGHSLLFRDVPAQFADSQSALAAGIASAMCAPLWTGDETVGLIEVDNRTGEAPFTEGDLERFGVIANRAALAVVGSELRDREHRSQLLQGLSAMIVHDLKSPLMALSGYLGLLAAEPLSKEQRELVETASSTRTWLSALVAGILDVARMEAGEVALTREPLDIEAEFARALAMVGSQLDAKEVHAEVSVGPDLPPIAADRELFRRVVMNLLANAVSFSPRGGAIRVSAVAEGEGVVVRVQDEGPGVPAEHRERIFDKFAQVGGGRSAEHVSVGLGLAFCRLAVEAHGGTIWVEGEPGKGACFLFSLPANQS